MMPAEVLIIGSVALDTLHTRHGSFPRVLGGSGTYAALAAAPFSRSHVVAVIGKDYPQEGLTLLKEKNVGLSGLEQKEGKTFHWEGRYADDFLSRETLATDLNVFADFDPKVPHELRSTPFVLLGNIAPQLQLSVLDQMQKPAFVMADTMNFWITGQKESLLKLISKVDLLVINDEESALLTGHRGLPQALKDIHAMGPKYVIIKRGEFGAILSGDNELFYSPAFPLHEVKDPTGAGDSFAGGFISFLAQKGAVTMPNLKKAVVAGAATASYCVEDVSVDRIKMLTQADIAGRYEAIKKMMTID